MPAPIKLHRDWFRGNGARWVLATAAWPLLAHAALAADGAEYALRWDPVEGGPRAVEEVAALLGLPAGKQKAFEVRYFLVTQASDLPVDAIAIVRERSTGQKTKSMYKLRSPTPLPASEERAGLRCPFKADAKGKREVDIGWTTEGAPKKSYSFSCDVDGFVRRRLPGSFAAQPMGCSSKVLRLETNDVKIERWTLPGGALALEVSWNGEDTPADLDRFIGQVVRPLLSHGAKPLKQSKTELGSRC